MLGRQHKVAVGAVFLPLGSHDTVQMFRRRAGAPPRLFLHVRFAVLCGGHISQTAFSIVRLVAQFTPFPLATAAAECAHRYLTLPTHASRPKRGAVREGSASGHM